MTCNVEVYVCCRACLEVSSESSMGSLGTHGGPWYAHYTKIKMFYKERCRRQTHAWCSNRLFWYSVWGANDVCKQAAIEHWSIFCKCIGMLFQDCLSHVCMHHVVCADLTNGLQTHEAGSCILSSAAAYLCIYVNLVYEPRTCTYNYMNAWQLALYTKRVLRIYMQSSQLIGKYILAGAYCLSSATWMHDHKKCRSNSILQRSLYCMRDLQRSLYCSLCLSPCTNI